MTVDETTAPQPAATPVPTNTIAALVALLLCAAWAYRDSWHWVYVGWRENPYFSHGPLVPVIAAYLVWRVRERLLTVEWRTYWPGLLLVAVAMLLFIGGRLKDINFIVGVSFVVLIHGLFLTAAGPKAWRVVAFPLGFLFFAVPVSWLLIHEKSFPLQLASARSATSLMHLLTGSNPVAKGAVITLAGEDYVVGVQCSGFKGLLGLTLVGLLVAYLTDTDRWRKIAIAALAMPIAMLSNIIRVFLILCVGMIWNHDFAVTKFHDFSGILMLLVAIAALMGVARLVVGPEAEVAGAPPPSGDGARRAQVGWRPVAATAVVLLVGANVGFALAPPKAPAPEVDLHKIPLEVGPWKGKEEEVGPEVYRELGNVSAILRTYNDDEKHPMLEMITICGRGRRSIHPPEACYRGGGNDIMDQEDVTVTIGGVKLPFRRLIVGRNGVVRQIALYTYTDGTDVITDWAKYQEASTQRREIDWTQVHLVAPWLGSVEKTMNRLMPFADAIWPEIQRVLQEAAQQQPSS